MNADYTISDKLMALAGRLQGSDAELVRLAAFKLLPVAQPREEKLVNASGVYFYTRMY